MGGGGRHLRLAPLALLCAARGGAGLDNGVGRTPPMGFNPWNCFGISASGSCKLRLPWPVPGPYGHCHGFNESVIMDVARAIAGGPLKTAGYEYVNLDCGYSTGFRDKDGGMVVNTTRYPHGMVWLGDEIHKLGLKFGMYSDAGKQQCCSRHYGPKVDDGSAGHEKADAALFASWGVDYLKHDNCGSVGSSYPAMRDALNATGRPIYYSVHGPTRADAVANCWRTTGDIGNSWGSILEKLKQNDGFAGAESPGGFNDPDMLEVGNLFSALGDAEGRSHFAMWCAAKAPLIVGTDVTNMTAATVATLTNAALIAVNQDPLGAQARIIDTGADGLLVMAGPLSGSRHVLVAVNTLDAAADITVDLGWAASGAVRVTELWSGKDMGTLQGRVSFKGVGGHDNVALELAGGSDPHTPAPAPDCFQHDTQYNSQKPGNTNLNTTGNPRSESSAASCQQACASTAGCVCFCYAHQSKCWLMTSCETPSHSDGFVSGNATCPPPAPSPRSAP